MTKCFVDDQIDQRLMMPPSLHDWLPEDHLARFVADLVPSLDLTEFYASYEEKDGRGQAAYHPVMMVRLLIYGYCIGVVSSRQIEKRTYEDVAFRYLSADEHPDHSTINEFRKRHLKALAGLFTQALRLCQAAGLVKLGHVALDGTKQQADASKHKAMSYGRMGEAEEKLKAQIEELLQRAEAVDAAEDEKERQGQSDKLPKELARRESRIMPDGAQKGSFVQAYNAQIAVDAEAQIIVAADITQDTNDKQQLAPMLEQVEQNTGAKPVAASADAGYSSTEQITDKRVEGIDLYVANERNKHGASSESADAKIEPTEDASVLEQMKQKLQSEAGQALYKMRKAIVEPVFGQIKECRGFRRFSLRGLENVRAEWKLVCLTHNFLKLFRSRRRSSCALFPTASPQEA